MISLLFFAVFQLIAINSINGLAILDEPPSRSSAWRFFFITSHNEYDAGLNCGGFQTQWRVNGGKCGICGDPYNGVRENELPNGKYAKNLYVTRKYHAGSTITAKVHIVDNKGGYFMFRLCPTTGDNTTRSQKEVTQQCLDQNLLEVVGSRTPNRFWIPKDKNLPRAVYPGKQDKIPFIVQIKLKLPDRLVCKHCVFQWEWITMGHKGDCGDGTTALGCGPQTTFRSCADIQIIP